MFFGSEKFESLIGELALHMLVMIEDMKGPPELLLEFKQKKREV